MRHHYVSQLVYLKHMRQSMVDIHNAVNKPTNPNDYLSHIDQIAKVFGEKMGHFAALKGRYEKGWDDHQ